MLFFLKNNLDEVEITYELSFALYFFMYIWNNF